MASLVSTDVTGVKGLQQKFRAMAKRVGGGERAEMCLRGAEVIAEETRQNILRQDLIESWALYNSVEAFKVNQWTAGVSVGKGSVARFYAATHEYGLDNQPITERQRRYFLWRCSEGEEMFCAMANKSTYTIPRRPYFGPALMSARSEAYDVMADYLLSILKEYEA